MQRNLRPAQTHRQRTHRRQLGILLRLHGRGAARPCRGAVPCGEARFLLPRSQYAVVAADLQHGLPYQRDKLADGGRLVHSNDVIGQHQLIADGTRPLFFDAVRVDQVTRRHNFVLPQLVNPVAAA